MTIDRPPRGTRPHNRRELILDAAGELFTRDGFPQVAMRDIAEAVAITPSALYRHFRGKDELLFEAIARQLADVEARFEDASIAGTSGLVAVLADDVVDRRGLGLLWQRESRHLDPGRRDQLRNELIGAQGLLVAAVSRERPELTPARSDLLAWATLAAEMSVSFQRVTLPRAAYVALLTDIGTSIMSCPLGAESDDGEPATRPARPSAESTADRLAASAARLFAERGYQTVGIDDVAADIGIAGPSVYHHFTGKAELLAAAIGDGARALVGDQEKIAAEQAPAAEQLAQLVRSYVGFSLVNHHVVDLMITETGNLDGPAAEDALAQQRAVVSRWVALYEELHEDVSWAEARVRVQAVLTLVNDVARTGHLRKLPGVRDDLVAIGSCVLGLPPRA